MREIISLNEKKHVYREISVTYLSDKQFSLRILILVRSKH